jgi:hypothetical protein
MVQKKAEFNKILPTSGIVAKQRCCLPPSLQSMKVLKGINQVPKEKQIYYCKSCMFTKTKTNKGNCYINDNCKICCFSCTIICCYNNKMCYCNKLNFKHMLCHTNDGCRDDCVVDKMIANQENVYLQHVC